MEQQSFIYKFLLFPQLRIWRYVALIVFFTIISVNLAFSGYLRTIPQMGNSIYWIIIVTILVYLITALTISKLASRYLLTGKYLQLAISIVLCASLYMVIPNVVYKYYITDYSFFSKLILLDNLADFAIHILCISGIIIPVFLREWIISSSHLKQLKIKQATSQVEQFKEQINPPSFFKILGKSKDSVKTDPDKASAMLMKLGQLLRYQLYDCNRQQVLLTAEVVFLQNFLELEKLYSSKFDYKMEIDKKINGIFVYPSILLPYVQSLIYTLDNEKEHHFIEIQVTSTDEVLYITLKTSDIVDEILFQKELLKQIVRLDTFYRDSYKLTSNFASDTEPTIVVLQLNRI